MNQNRLKEKVKESLFIKEQLTERKKERIMENILIAHYADHKKKRSTFLEMVGFAVCLALLMTVTLTVIDSDLDPPIKEASNQLQEAPYVSAAYMKRASEIAQRDLDILDVTYFSMDKTIYLDIMVSDSFSNKKMKELTIQYLEVLSHLYQSKNDQLGEIWDYYHLEITIKPNSDYPSLAFMDEEDNTFFLKGSKRIKEASMSWSSPSN
ncbi:hypothetical protein [Anaerobacillus sp. 1_MG-2023]|uniref:hypothetical protein n=1 Tax=Bacillales TaxID=1385 RepID=UPI0026E2A9E6|nr:hypothetical protein [Anaerobacillus sp. 1_MG-2023]MDO6656615.1 hypothetical protein [Anaerobacillus sp. 1_MG-2023]